MEEMRVFFLNVLRVFNQQLGVGGKKRGLGEGPREL